MEDFKTSEIKHLINLLNLKEDNSDDDSDIDSAGNINPYSMNLNKTPANYIDDKVKNTERPNYYEKSTNSKDIWSEDEVLCEDNDEAEMREKPHYEMIYQQRVTPDDMFLQFDGKGPGINSCECLLVKIKLRETSSKDDILLKISTTALVCKTEKFYLDLDFPKHVDPSKCFSTWNQSDSMLSVKLVFEDKHDLQL